MIKFEHTEVVGWEAAIRGMRNPLESWEKSDSDCVNNFPLFDVVFKPRLGPNDLSLMMRLRNAGTDHRKFMRMIVVYVDITAPLYWWKEFDTYKVGTVANSCSTMHCIHRKEFTLNDFSHEQLMDCLDGDYEAYNSGPGVVLRTTIAMLNMCRDLYLQTKDKKYWWQMIQLLPTSYNQKRTVMLNYEVLANIYKSRKDHKLDEWHDFCAWIWELPYSELITGHRKLPPIEDMDELFEEVKKVDSRVVSRVINAMGNMRVLEFLDKDGATLWAANLNKYTLAEVLEWIKEEIKNLTIPNLEFGA